MSTNSPVINSIKKIVILSTLVLSGCFEENPLVPPSGTNGLPVATVTVEEISGTWNATSATFTSQESSVQIQVVSDGGSVTLESQTNGRFTLIVLPPQGAAQIITGLFEIDQGVFTVSFDVNPQAPVVWTVLLLGNTLEIKGPVSFDFQNVGDLQPAHTQMILVKG